MRPILILFVLAGFFLPACNGALKEIQALDKETKEIHDSAMNDLAEMNRVSLAIKAFLTTALMTPEQSAKYSKVLSDMEKAESDMMEWMSKNEPVEGKPEKEALAYLKDQKAKITKNRDDIRAATEAGKKLLPAQ
ncbi:MAG TPA: hypothetical protein PLO67_04290 [Saprospiraceae bacterium]|nr:hypothetical protein [Saprospiraceae bacterium]HPI05126.1 hypothetical protein [Saprospiraceae bacterium]